MADNSQTPQAQIEQQIAQLNAALAGQESLRASLGDAVIETILATFRAQIENLRGQLVALAQPQPATPLSPEQMLNRVQSYLPHELAAKIQASGNSHGERKQVTVMFADLSGFTALSERLDAEEVALLTSEALKELAEAVYQYEGYIDKFVGDALMVVFGAPLSHEDDPERALRTALAMRERLEIFNRRWQGRLDEPLRLHIGINTGQVIAGNVGTDMRLSYTVMGDTVNTASRLEGAAQPGQTLVSRQTYRLTQEAFTFQALDPIQVKGKREPIVSYELQRARLMPGKARGLKGLTAQMIGREAEMARLQEVVEALEQGQGRLVMISGEAGLGKSRLISEWQQWADQRVRWLEGRGFAHTTDLAFGPFLDLFRRYSGIKDEDTEAEARQRFQTAVATIFPNNAEAAAIFGSMLAMRLAPAESDLINQMPADLYRRRLFELIKELFVKLATVKPVVLVLEDVHWADATSLELVEYLLPLVKQLPLALVRVSRSHTDPIAPKLTPPEIEGYAPFLVRIPLAPLSDDSSSTMISQLLATPNMPEQVNELIVGKAEGNPFFVEEVIRALVDRGALIRTENGEGWQPTHLLESVNVPDTLQGVLMSRLDRLPDETKVVVQQASVIGRIFLYRVLQGLSDQMLGIDTDLSHLEREELIRERSRQPEVEYIFKHALTQEVAYQSLLGPRRIILHRRVGEVLERIFAERLAEFQTIIARHFLLGKVWDKAATYLTQSGEAAARQYAYAEARTSYRDALLALDHLPANPANNAARIDVTTRLVSVSYGSDKPEALLLRLREVEIVAFRLQDTRRLAQVHYWMGRELYYNNQMREAAGYFQRVLAVGQELNDAELLAFPASVMGRLLVLQGQFKQAMVLLTQAAPALERAGNWEEWVLNLSFQGTATAIQGQYGLAVIQEEKAIAFARQINNATALSAVYVIASFVQMVGGNGPAMLETARNAVEVARQAGDKLFLYVAMGIRSWAENICGDTVAASRSITETKAMAQNLGGQVVMAEYYAIAEAEIALNTAQHAASLELAATAVKVAQSVGNNYAAGLAQRVWGQAWASQPLPNYPAAHTHLETSVGLLEGCAALLDLARTHLVWGKLLLAQGDTAAAKPHLAAAHDQFERSQLANEIAAAQSALATANG